MILPFTTLDNEDDGKVLTIVNKQVQWATPTGGSGSGGTKFDVVQFADDGVSYTGTITGSSRMYHSNGTALTTSSANGHTYLATHARK